jgi:hypothetical protein
VPAGAPFSSALRTDALPDTYRWGVRADAQGLHAVHDDVISQLVGAAESAERFFINLGHTIADFFEGIGEKIKEGLTFVLHKAKGVFQFVCAIGDKIKKFVLSTLEEAGTFFKWLWQQVKTGLEQVWDFLKLLFDWNDIVLVRNAMVEAADEALSYVISSVGQMKAQVASGFDKAIAQIEEWRKNAGAAPAMPRRPSPGSSILDDINKATAPIQKVLDQVSGNSVVAWVTQRLGKLADDIVHVEGPNPAAEALDAAEHFATGLLGDEINDLLAMWERLEADITRLFGQSMPRPGEMNFETVKDALVIVGADVLEGVLSGLRDFVLRSIDLMQSMIGVARDAMFAKVSFPFIEKLVELVAPGTHIDTSFRLVDGIMMLCAIPATIAYKLMFGEAPFKKGDVIPLAFGNVTVQSGADAARVFSWIGGLVNSIFNTFSAGFQAFKIASATSEGKEPPPMPAWLRWIGTGIGAIALAAEACGRHTDKGNEVEGMEWAMLSISALLTAKTVALLQYAELKMGSEKMKDLSKPNNVIEIIGRSVRLILRTAVFGKIIDDDLHSNSDTEEDKAVESLAWITSLFDQAGAILMTSAGLVQDPKTRVILLGVGAGNRGLSSLINIIRVPVVARTRRMLTN